MKLDRAEAYGLGPSEDYARELDKTMNTLNTRRAGGRIRLRAAGRSARQARAAGDIATAYSDAAEALADVSISPALRSANDDVVRSFRQAAAAYERLAGAARARSRRRYEAARGTVSRREAAVSRQLESLTDLGYAVGS
jgi:hypothetical protein